MEVYKQEDAYVLFAEEIHITVPFTRYVLHRGEGKYPYAMLYYHNHYTGVIIHQLGLPSFLHNFAYAELEGAQHATTIYPESD